MKTSNIFTLFCIFIFCAISGYSQNNELSQIIEKTFQNRVQVEFRFPLQPDTVMTKLARIISIDNVKSDSVDAVSSKKDFQDFLQMNIPFRILPDVFQRFPSGIWKMSDFMSKDTQSWDTYPTYQSYLNMMNQFVTDYPSLCKLDTIGYSVQNRLILCLQISNSPGIPENKPSFFYTSTIHGDEVVGYVLMLRLIDYLLSNYGTNSKITNLVNNVKIYINPNANPDGTYYGGNNTVTGAIRYNQNMSDLNRNYPDMLAGPNPNGPWEKETIAFMDFANRNNFVMSANFHGGAELLNYPWDVNDLDNHADRLWWIYVCKQYADTLRPYSPSDYFSDMFTGSTIPGVSNGGNWYVINGGRQDYMNYFKNCREVTIEMSDEKMPPSTQLPNFWNYNYRSLLNYIEQVLYGIRGIVTDECTGNPVIAKIEILNHDVDNSFVYSAPFIGNYHRPIKAGTYNMKISAAGYQDKFISNVSVSDNSTTVQNVSLVPVIPSPAFAVSSLNLCSGEVNFQNQTFASAATTFTWDFGDGNTSSEFSPNHFYSVSGIFNVKLSAENCAGKDSLLKTNLVYIDLLTPPTASGVSHCGSSAFTLSASGQGTISWWNEAGTLLYNGTQFTTPLLNETTTYYVSGAGESWAGTAGKTDTSGTSVLFSETNEHGLIFNSYAQTILKTVDVYSNLNGSFTIELKNSLNAVIQSMTAQVQQGLNTIVLNFTIPVENNLKLVCNSPLGLAFNSSSENIGFPMEIPNMFKITGSTNQSNPLKTYYFFYNLVIQKQTTFFGGLINKTSTGAYFSNSTEHGLLFDVSQSCLLKSVKVYANQAGNRTITLYNNNNEILQQSTVNIPSGESRITLNFPLPADYSLKITCSASPNLWRDGSQTASELSYPFNINNLVNIFSNTADNLRYYYYFYDWEIYRSEPCESSKIPVVAEIHHEPVPQFQTQINGTSVQFVNTSTGGGSFSWNFGDGSTSTDFSPSHQYDALGEYTVSLLQSNSCTDSSVSSPVFLTAITSELQKHTLLYPNPAINYIQIRSSSIISEIELYDLYGRLINSYHPFTQNFIFDVQEFPSGLYVLTISTPETIETHKILIRK